MNLTLALSELKVNEVEEQVAKHRFLEFFNGAVQVYTEVVPDCAKRTLQAIIRGRVDPESIIHSDPWRGYNSLVDMGYKKYFRIHHGNDVFANGKNHINGIESFWPFAKRRLEKFHGIPKSTFHLHLKECEFRFNNRNNNIYKLLLQNINAKALN